MQHQERECPQCDALYSGRADKKFCSDACKAQYRRDNLQVKSTDDDAEDTDDEDWDAENDDWDEDEEDEDVESNMLLYKKVNLFEGPPSSITRLEQANEEERARQYHALELIQLRQLRIEAQLKQEAEEKAIEEAASIKSLHNFYSALIRKCLKQDGQELDEDDLETWVEELDAASEKYLAHPSLHQPENAAHKRLKDIFWLRDTLNAQLEELRDQQASYFKQVQPVFLELPPKRKARFRANLVP